MEQRLAVIAIVVEDEQAVESVNHQLHQYAPYIIGRMGIPLQGRGMNLISIAIEGSSDIINGLTGGLGRIPNVSAKTAFSKK